MTNTTPRKPFQKTSDRDIGIMAALGLAVCCGLPLLLTAGAIAAIGGFLRSPWVIAAGLVLAISAVAYARARRRAGCACELPDQASGATEHHDRVR